MRARALRVLLEALQTAAIPALLPPAIVSARARLYVMRSAEDEREEGEAERMRWATYRPKVSFLRPLRLPRD